MKTALTGFRLICQTIFLVLIASELFTTSDWQGYVIVLSGSLTFEWASKGW